MLRVYQRGSIAWCIDAMPLLSWGSGCTFTAGRAVDHVTSVVGWGKDASQGQYWIVREFLTGEPDSPVVLDRAVLCGEGAGWRLQCRRGLGGGISSVACV